MTRKFIVAALAALASTAAAAEWNLPSPDGWSWYHDPSKPPPEYLGKPVPVAPPAEQGPPPLSAAWFRANMERYRDLAIDHPTPENVRLYKLLERVAMDKASAFARQSELQAFSDPMLDESATRPMNTLGAQLANAEAGEGKTAAMKAVGRKAGIWFFYGHDCPYCAAEAPILEAVQRRYGMTVYPISLDGLPLDSGQFPEYATNSGQAEKLGVSVTPTLFLVTPDGDMRAVARGLVAQDEFEQRALMTAASAGWITDKEYRDALPVRNDPAESVLFASNTAGPRTPQEEVLALMSQVSPAPASPTNSDLPSTPVALRRPMYEEQ